MTSSNKILIAALCFVCLFSVQASVNALSTTFYDDSCRYAKFIIWDEVSKAIQAEKRMGASLLRLHFHDCFVNGCDASVLLDDTATFTGEKTAIPNNNSIRGFEVVDAIKARLETACPKTVSCADILAIAARDSVHQLGGIFYDVELGRRDSTTASFADANADLPAPFFSLAQLKDSFSNVGLDETDLVALSGAHTIGKATCAAFRNRIYNDTNINSAYANSLKTNCPTTGGNANLAPLDHQTPNHFDNDYYKNLVVQKGLLHSDQELFNGGSTDSLVQYWSTNSNNFGHQFAISMKNMGRISPLTGTNGQIRVNCRKVNT